MAIKWEILGSAGADNALLVIVDTGQSQTSLLFDCGERCLDGLRPSEIQSIEHLCFSHFHMDHVAGFDGFFRHNYNRPSPPVKIWGPPGTIDLMNHRFHGFSWNLHEGQSGTWEVHEIDDTQIRAAHFYTREAFLMRPEPDQAIQKTVIHRSEAWHLEALSLPHGSIPSIAYRVVEAPKRNVDPEAMTASGLHPGPWLKSVLNEAIPGSTHLEVGGRSYLIEELRQTLLKSTPGTSIAWVTDFRLSPGSHGWLRLVDWLDGTETLVCESQYLSSDALLAEKNAHMTADLVGQLAAEAKVGHLVLQHLSRRYSRREWLAMKNEAKTHSLHTSFPPHWNLVASQS